MGSTGIEWCEAVWNPVVGCSKVSAGCKNCYAIGMARRLVGNRVRGYEGTIEGGTWSGRVNVVEEAMLAPLKRKKPTVYFVNSMGDLFHEGVADGVIDRVFAVMALCPQHRFIVLTKREKRMREYLVACDVPGWTQMPPPYGEHDTRQEDRNPTHDRIYEIAAHAGIAPFKIRSRWPLPNVVLGVSVEDQAALGRAGDLVAAPAARRILSLEPLLGPVSFRWASWDDWAPHARRLDADRKPVMRDGRELAGSVDHLDGLRMLDGVIVGGESGPGARPCDVEWIRGIVRQCQAAGVACFVKQLGRAPVMTEAASERSGMITTESGAQEGYVRLLLKDKKGGDMSEWPADLRVREAVWG